MQKLPKSVDNFLVTGATGFIGSALVRELIKQNKKISVIVRNKKVNWRLKNYKTKLLIYEADITAKNLQKTIQKIKPSYIFHTTSFGTRPEESDFAKMLSVNIMGTVNLLESLKSVPFVSFINTGTSSEYGINSNPHKETDLPAPVNNYGISKYATTLVCQKYAKEFSMPIITLRLFSPFGYFEEKKRLIPWIISHALLKRDIPLANPAFVRDFIFIDDVVDAYFRAVLAKHKKGDIYNIGSGQEYSIKNVVQLVTKITKSTSRPLWHTTPKQQRQLEPKHWKADTDKAKNGLHWKVSTNLEDGLEKTITWIRNNPTFYA